MLVFGLRPWAPGRRRSPRPPPPPHPLFTDPPPLHTHTPLSPSTHTPQPSSPTPASFPTRCGPSRRTGWALWWAPPWASPRSPSTSSRRQASRTAGGRGSRVRGAAIDRVVSAFVARCLRARGRRGAAPSARAPGAGGGGARLATCMVRPLSCFSGARLLTSRPPLSCTSASRPRSHDGVGLLLRGPLLLAHPGLDPAVRHRPRPRALGRAAHRPRGPHPLGRPAAEHPGLPHDHHDAVHQLR